MKLDIIIKIIIKSNVAVPLTGIMKNRFSVEGPRLGISMVL